MCVRVCVCVGKGLFDAACHNDTSNVTFSPAAGIIMNTSFSCHTLTGVRPLEGGQPGVGHVGAGLGLLGVRSQIIVFYLEAKRKPNLKLTLHF